MIKRDVKSILPVAYDVKNALWYELIKKDYDRYSYRILLISYLVAIIIPIGFLVNEIYNGRVALLINYAMPSVLMIVMIMYLIVYKNIAVMKILTALFALAGFFCASLLPGSHDAYIIILFNFVPITFSLYGLRGGVRWFFLFMISLSILFLLKYANIVKTLPLYLNPEYIPVALITLVIIFLILYTSQRQHEKIIRKLVYSIAYDPVTCLPNKDSFLKCINHISDSVIAIINITNFKSLATLFGYEFSDHILIMVTETLQKLSSEIGFAVYRLNWHEFGLQIPLDNDYIMEKSPESVLKIILDEVSSRKILMEDIDVNLAISIGGVIITGGNYSTALSRADTALNYCLDRHSNITLYRDGMDLKSETFNRVKKYSILQDNIINGTLMAYLQPVVSSATGEIYCYELLLRVRVADHLYDSVQSYIKVAKDTNLYPMLTDYILDQAWMLIKKGGLPVSVNISQADIMNSSVLEKIECITRDESYNEGKLILEIVESEEFANIEECIRFINRVQSLGVLVAIDDFGSGYSNILNLFRLNLDIVKIDGELIRRIEHDHDAYYFIKGIYDFCTNSGYKVVAEYVENNNILMKIKEIGIEFCQGFMFGKPEAPEDIPGLSGVYSAAGDLSLIEN